MLKSKNNVENAAESLEFDSIRTESSKQYEIVFGLQLKVFYPDSDGLYDGLILPRQQANVFLVLASLSFFSGVYACIRGYYDLSLVPFGVGTTSVLYWIFPLSWYYHKPNSSSWISIFFHSLVHILGNVSNIVLYSGYVPPLNWLK